MKRYGSLRAIGIALVALGWTASGWGQEPSAPEPQRPEAILAVKADRTGTALVDVLVVDAAYPGSVLRDRLERVGQASGSPLKGLRVFEDRPFGASSPGVLKASFGSDRLIEQGTIDLQSLARGLSGGQPNPLRSFTVLLTDIRLAPDALMSWTTSSVDVSSRPAAGRLGVEYNVRVLTDDADKIEIPRRAEDRVVSTTLATGRTFDPVAIVLLAVAALAVGALVYSLLLRKRQR